MSKPIKANDRQRAASNPRTSVWVTANAGSGKTHVLAHRVIRLMLAGADPASILCLTYTKAAASEMAERVHEILASWVTMTDAELAESLGNIGAQSPGPELQATARRLFTRALETPGGLKIQTIHAFCERLLQLFPVEAGVVPGFSVADDRTSAQMMETALEKALSEAESGKDDKLAESLDIASRHAQASQLSSYILQVAALRSRFSALNFDAAFVAAGLKRLRSEFQLHEADTISSILSQLACDGQLWNRCLAALRQGGKNARTLADSIVAVRNNNPGSLEEWRKTFFTGAGDSRKVSTKKIQDFDPTFDNLFNAIVAEIGKASACECLAATEALLTIAVRVFEAYNAEKRRLGLLDFDDLIFRTQELLTAKHAAQWVLYKLDRGLSHVLVDEAQDTNSGQWCILEALTEEFFAGEGAQPDKERTVFVVGDRKQSIYSFQGADVTAFEAAESGFANRIKGAGKRFENVPLTLSFRSTPEVLTAVDAVFATSSAALPGLEGLGSPYSPHQTHRKETGVYEIWPLVVAGDKAEDDVWQPLMERPAQESRHRALARKIAMRLRSWIGRRMLSGGKVVEPGDILILLRSRGKLFEAILAELQAAGIPAAGADRLKLENNIAVLDLMALMQFCLLAEDDYSLACVLKSPLVPRPLDDDQLLQLAANRGRATLWSQLVHSRHDLWRENAHWLAVRRETMRTQRPYEFLSQVIVQRRAAILARLGSEASDAMNALLQAALEHEMLETPSYPGFLRWFRSGETQVKRDMDQSTGGVRVMTIHGSKGLEAPIVILAVDVNAKPGGSGDQIITPDLEGFGLFPFWYLSNRPLDSVPKWKKNRKAAEQEESHRLLYVALTRAKDELYVCGCGNGSKTQQDNWYDLVDKARPPSMREVLENGITVAYRLGSDPINMEKEASRGRHKISLPAWFRQPHHQPPKRQVRNDSQAHDETAAARGTILHKLLQELPSIPPERRHGYAQQMAQKHKLDAALADRIVRLTLDERYQDLFNENGLSEVPVSARLHDGQLVVSGRVDRLILGEAETVIIDYKSGTPATIDETHDYALQLARYMAAMEAVRPGVPAKAALFWIEVPRLDWIGKDVLDGALARLLFSTSP
jgi:ATP-dependent helicase/nuclease subunit A